MDSKKRFLNREMKFILNISYNVLHCTSFSIDYPDLKAERMVVLNFVMWIAENSVSTCETSKVTVLETVDTPILSAAAGVAQESIFFFLLGWTGWM